MTGKYLPKGFTIDGKYRLVRPIGSGGFSHVYQGLHKAMDRVVAIKIFDPQQQLDQDSSRALRRARRFEQEAQLVSQLEHPNTVTIYDFGVADDGKAYLVMEFIEGPTLKQVLRKRAPLDPDEAIPIFLQILGSLEEAHHRNILHRDLKPANIMLAENFKGEQIVKVLDFGIARTIRAEAAENKENSRIFLGTPRYAAPEQFKRLPLSLATDIYGVGALLWQCLVGKPMIESGDIRDCMAHAASPAPWEVPDEAGLPAQLCDIIERALEKDPANRYPDAQAMMEALEACTTIDRGDLPEIEADDGLLRSERIVDPNVLAADESENFFLNPGPRQSPPPMPGPGRDEPSNTDLLRPPSRHDKTSKTDRGARPPIIEGPSFDEEPLELDETARRRRTRRPSPTPGDLREPAPPRTATRSSLFGPKLLIPLLLILLAIAAFFLFGAPFLSDESPPPAQEPTIIAGGDEGRAQIIEGTTRRPSSFMEDSRFSIDGITIAMRADGWRVRQATQPVEMTNYTYTPLTIDRRELRLDLALYEVRTEATMEQLLDDRGPEHHDVVLDHILARITPRSQESDDSEVLAMRLQGFLQSYHALVTEQGAATADQD